MSEKERNNDSQSDSTQHGSPAPKSPERHGEHDQHQKSPQQIPDVNPPSQVQRGHRDRDQI